MERPIVIEDRQELIFMLAEAAEIEHMVMCEYLFAAFSLKTDTDEGVSAEQLAAIRRWRQVILGVAAQEMLHLALANNLLTTLGAAPHFERPNFPQRSRYYPPGVQFALLPFGEQALRHFLFLERPEGMSLQDAAGFVVTETDLPTMRGDDIVEEEQQFGTVGHLYRGIEQGFRHLVERHGEHRVFIGPTQAQATREYFHWPALIPVTDLTSAITAIETIVEEGEGARGDWSQAHFGRFVGVLNEYLAMKRANPGFTPARPATPTFVRQPPDVSEVTLCSEPLTIRVAELFTASYEVLLQLLGRFFIHSHETARELQVLSDAAVDLMFGVVEPLGSLLTRLPVGPDRVDMTAGPSFEVNRTGYLLLHDRAGWIRLHERLTELANYANRQAAPEAIQSVLTGVEEQLRRQAARVERHSARAEQATHAES
jgi:hypothetical protein